MSANNGPEQVKQGEGAPDGGACLSRATQLHDGDEDRLTVDEVLTIIFRVRGEVIAMPAVIWPISKLLRET
jgi:hypothetical protein